MSDEPLPPPPAGRFAALQAVALLAHLALGATLIATLLLAPLPPEAGTPLTTPRVWAAGVTGFGTFVAALVSTGATTVVYRGLSTFRAPATRGWPAAIAGVLAANALGCTAGAVAITLWITSTLVGDVHLN